MPKRIGPAESATVTVAAVGVAAGWVGELSGSDGAKRNKEERYGQSGQTKRSRKAHRTKNSRGKRSILSSASLPLVCQYGKPYCLRAIFRKKTGFHQVRRTNLLAR